MTVFTSTPMRTLFRYLLLAALLVGAWLLVAPYLPTALYAMRLASMPAPTTVTMPVSGVRPQGLRDTWHGARSGGRQHEGIDIFARRGTEVQAATEGIVLRVGNNPLGGRVVWVLGPGAQRHYYAHLDRYAEVSAGMHIDAGTVLGYVGTTGNAAGTPPHLHYGIYQAGGAINPYPVLRKGAPRVQARDAAR
jgi:murein DD-endopeptidase MepM/ murein hydrolase activator NlpD